MPTPLAAGFLLLSIGATNQALAQTIEFTTDSTVDIGSTTTNVTALIVNNVITGTLTGAGGTLDYTGGVFRLGGTVNGTQQTLDMVGLSNFVSNNFSQEFGVGGQVAGGPGVTGTTSGTLVLAAGTNVITASLFGVGYIGRNVSSFASNSGSVLLGQSNTINADQIQIGNNQSSGTLSYQNGITGGTLVLRGTNGTGSVANWNIGTGANSNYTAAIGVVDLSQGSLNAQVDNLLIGESSGLGQPATGSLIMGNGTLEAGTIILGQLGVGGDGFGAATGTLTINGGTVRTRVLTIGDLSATAGSATGTVNINGGAVLDAQTIQAGAGTALRVINWNDGTIGNYADGDNMTVSGVPILLSDSGPHTFEVDGASAIATVSSVLSDASGAVSGGALTKAGAGTLALTGTNTYTGGTSINAGVLSVGADANLGAAVGGLTFNGGTLQFASGLTTARTVTLNTAGTFDTQANANTLAGVIGGPGALVKQGSGTLTLTGTNTYSGGTTITDGVLQIGDGGTTGSLVGDVSNAGTLVFNRSGVVSFGGIISGAGSLTQAGSGTTILTGANTYSGGTALKTGQITVGHNTALGSGPLAMDEGTTLGFSADGLNLANAIELTGTTDPIIDTGAFTETLSGAISGTGALTKQGSGVLVLSGANTYSGATDVAQGTLRAGGPGTFSAASAHIVEPGATLDTAGFNQQIAALSNSGRVSLLSASPGSTLTVTGPYSGNSGVLVLGAGVVGGTGASDRLVLDGPSASASGNTTIQINNLSGLGALTSGNGIEVIGANNGATTTAQTTRDAFSLAGGHVDAGAYEYRLYAADADGTGENWYLRSALASQPGGSGGQTPTYRSEVPLLTALPAQIRQEDLAMLSNLHRRVGDEDTSANRSTKTSSGDPDEFRESWVRLVYADLNISESGTAQAESDGQVAGLQIGTDLWANAQWHTGIYFGYLAGDVDVSGNARGQNGRVGKTDLSSNYLGAYATWRNNEGWYVDSVLQGGSHHYDINPDSNQNKSGEAKSYAASVETGKAYPLNDQWSIEPQAQLIFQHSDFDNLNLSAAQVEQDTGDGWIARLGVRVKGDLLSDQIGRVQPYGHLNVYHASIGHDKTTFAGPAGLADLVSNGDYISGEAAAGATIALTSTMSLYGEAGHMWDISGDTRVESDVQASMGVRVRW